MQIARALLGDDLLQAFARARFAEVAHLDLAVLDHLGLEAALAADGHGTKRNPERGAAATHRLHQFHEIGAEHLGADFFAQRRLEFELFHHSPSASSSSQSSTPSNTFLQGPVSVTPEKFSPSVVPSTTSS